MRERRPVIVGGRVVTPQIWLVLLTEREKEFQSAGQIVNGHGTEDDGRCTGKKSWPRHKSASHGGLLGVCVCLLLIGPLRLRLLPVSVTSATPK